MRADIAGVVTAIAALFLPVPVTADRQAAEMRRLSLDPRIATRLPKHCVVQIRNYKVFNSDGACMRLFPLRRLRGIWYRGLESSYFFPGQQTRPTEKQLRSDTIWLDTGDIPERLMPQQLRKEGFGVFLVDMVAHAPPIEGAFGHWGMSHRGVLLDRMISIRRID